MRRLDIGVASYKNPDALEVTLRSIEQQSTTDWICYIVHNPSDGDERTREVIQVAVARNSRFVPIWCVQNKGYSGAVNVLLSTAKTEYIAYLDNDVEILTKGWDERLCNVLDIYHEIGLVFPNGGCYPIQRNGYQEVMWGVGYAWVINRLAMSDTGLMDETIGHQEEADYCMRLRMKGWKCAALSDVLVKHNATATNSPESVERINRGVVRFVDKWNNYFNGKNFNYHSTNVTRWEDWPPNALYLEEYWKPMLPDLNNNPEVVTLVGREYDLIRVPRFKDFYRGRIV